MNVMIVSSAPPNWGPLTDLTWATMRKWCDRHGYDFFGDVSNIKVPTQTPWVNETPKSPMTFLRTMVKFPLLEHFMTESQCRKKYDYVVWLDADCVVTRYDMTLEYLMGSETGGITVAYDVNGLHPTFIGVKNSAVMRGLIWACKEAGTRMWVDHGWSDIMALRFFAETPPYKYEFTYASAQFLCAMPPKVHPMPDDVRDQYTWTPDSFSVHLSALSLDQRVAIAKEYVEKLGLLK